MGWYWISRLAFHDPHSSSVLGGGVLPSAWKNIPFATTLSGLIRPSPPMKNRWATLSTVLAMLSDTKWKLGWPSAASAAPAVSGRAARPTDPSPAALSSSRLFIFVAPAARHP